MATTHSFAKFGPVTNGQLARFRRAWKQGQHIVVTGPTSSGKSLLTRGLLEQHVQRGIFVIVFVCKLQPDETIVKDYAGFTRWHRMKKNPMAHERRILLWPKTEGMKPTDALLVQKEIFEEAWGIIGAQGRWTVSVDEGLYMCNPSFLNLSQPLALAQQVGRSGYLSVVTLAQRPSHLPLVVYSSASHAFIGRTREASDVKRLSEIGGRLGSKELSRRIAEQALHDFTWLDIAGDGLPEPMNTKM